MLPGPRRVLASARRSSRSARALRTRRHAPPRHVPFAAPRRPTSLGRPFRRRTPMLRGPGCTVVRIRSGRRIRSTSHLSHRRKCNPVTHNLDPREWLIQNFAVMLANIGYSKQERNRFITRCSCVRTTNSSQRRHDDRPDTAAETPRRTVDGRVTARRGPDSRRNPVPLECGSRSQKSAVQRTR